jgi:magnesium-transporting ATPase (P-type)
MLFAGTAVASGSGVGVVTSIGMSSEIGKIQSQIAAASEEEEDTPLKQKLDEFGELLAKVGCPVHEFEIVYSRLRLGCVRVEACVCGRLCFN